MRETKIKVQPFPLLDVVKVEGYQQVNEHGYLTISGHIGEEEENSYLSVAMRPNLVVSVTTQDEFDNEQIFFRGVITNFIVKVENEVRLLILELQTNSLLMDLVPHIRSYQSSSITFDSIINSIKSGYGTSTVITNAGENKKIPGLIMQYQETDWAFVKRLASHFHTVLVPDTRGEGIRYTFGLPQESNPKKVQTKYFTIGRCRSLLPGGTKEGSTVYYDYLSREIYDLGSSIIINGMKLFVFSIKTELSGSELYHTYRLTTKDGFMAPKLYNETAIGISLNATVTSVHKDVVQIAIHNDENKAKAGARWFQYATVYSSPDGTGWYCMPEVGDDVRIYIPDENEENAYVISSSHLQASNSARTNPNFKSIMNPQKKEVLFTPSSLIITNNAGMSIELSDEEGIKIISDKAIIIKSEDAIDISSTTAKLEVSAPEAVSLKQGSTKMLLDEKIHFEGSRFRIN